MKNAPDDKRDSARGNSDALACWQRREAIL